MLRKHRQRYGTAASAADRATEELGSPSPWLDADARAAWQRVVKAAPPNLLRAIDAGLVESLAVALVRHQRWATLLQQAWARVPVDPQTLAMIDRQAHRAAGQIATLATALGLSPPARSRIALPVPSPPEPGSTTNPHARFKIIRLNPPAPKAGQAAR
jgi:P27 family predicted phage terminase small subunit